MTDRRRGSVRGFTLIELVVVLAILGILLAIALPRYLAYRKRAYKEEIANVLQEVKSLSWAYYQDHDLLPDDLGDIAFQMPGGTVWTSPDVMAGGGSVAFVRWPSSGIGGPLTAADQCSVTLVTNGDSDQGCTF